MTDRSNTGKARRITAQDLAEAARQGVERALAARQSAFVELTPEQIEQVSGGATAATKPTVPTVPPIQGLIIKPPIHGVIIKPPVFGLVIDPQDS
jgi:hypothetical protein